MYTFFISPQNILWGITFRVMMMNIRKEFCVFDSVASFRILIYTPSNIRKNLIFYQQTHALASYMLLRCSGEWLCVCLCHFESICIRIYMKGSYNIQTICFGGYPVYHFVFHLKNSWISNSSDTWSIPISWFVLEIFQSWRLSIRFVGVITCITCSSTPPSVRRM